MKLSETENELEAARQRIDAGENKIALLLAEAKKHFITNGEYTRGDAGRFYRWAKKVNPDWTRYHINKMVRIGEILMTITGATK